MGAVANREKIIEIYQEMVLDRENRGLGVPTLNELAAEVAERGIINPATRKPFSYSTMHYILSRVPKSARQKLVDRKARKTPVIINMKDYPKISEFMMSTIEGDVIDEDDLTIDKIRNRHVYGMGNLAILMHAKQVWWLGSGIRNLTVVDEIREEFRWKKVHIIIDN